MINSINELHTLVNLQLRGLESSASPLSSTPAQNTTDVVSIHAPVLLTDEEAEAAMASVQQTTAESPAEALSVHQGLSYNRVMQLLEGL